MQPIVAPHITTEGKGYIEPPLECVLCKIQKRECSEKPHSLEEKMKKRKTALTGEVTPSRPAPEEDAKHPAESGPFPEGPKWDPSHFGAW